MDKILNMRIKEEANIESLDYHVKRQNHWSDIFRENNTREQLKNYLNDKGATVSFYLDTIPQDELINACKYFKLKVKNPWSVLFTKDRMDSKCDLEDLIKIPIENINPPQARELPMVDIDPENFLSSIRPHELIGTIIATHSSIPYNAANNCFTLSEHVDLNSDTFICDVTSNSGHQIAQVSTIVDDLNLLFQTGHSETDKKKYFILISSLMTWAETTIEFEKESKEGTNHQKYPPLPQNLWYEWYYPIRKPHHIFQGLYYLENKLINLAHKFPDYISIVIVGVGLIYGPTENSLESTISRFLKSFIDIPVFGSGDNIIPLIHRSDIFSFVRALVHKFPINYKYVFLTEKPITQINLVATLMSQLGRCKTMIQDVSTKYGPLFNYNDAEVHLLSSSFPIEGLFRSKLSWNPSHSLNCYLPTIIERYISLMRTKPICLILLGSDAEISSSVGQRLSEILNVSYIDRNTALCIYNKRMQCKKDNANNGFPEMLGATSNVGRSCERFLMDVPGFPRGEQLVQLLNALFLEPEIRIKGYILDGFPRTLYEAKIMLRVLDYQESKRTKNIVEADDLYIPVVPTDIIVLTSSDDTKGSRFTADLVKRKVAADIFRCKLGSQDSMLECFEDLGIFPKVFDISEYADMEDLTQSVVKTILQLPGQTSCTSPPNVDCQEGLDSYSSIKIDMSNESTAHENYECFKGELLGNCLLIEIGTFWNKENSFVKKYKFNKIENTENVQNSCDNMLSNKVTAKQLVKKYARMKSSSVGLVYDNALIFDDQSRVISGKADGNVSQHCVKHLTPAAGSPAKAPSVKSELQTPIKESNQEIIESADQTAIKRNIPSPVIKWMQGEPRVLNGKIVEWTMPDIVTKCVQFCEGDHPECQEGDATCKQIATVYKPYISFKPPLEESRLKSIAKEGRIEKYGTVRHLIIDESYFTFKQPLITLQERKFVTILSRRPDDLVRVHKLVTREEWFENHSDNHIFIDKANGNTPYVVRRSVVLAYMQQIVDGHPSIGALECESNIKNKDDFKIDGDLTRSLVKRPDGSVVLNEKLIYHGNKQEAMFFSQVVVADDDNQSKEEIHSQESAYDIRSVSSTVSTISTISVQRTILKKTGTKKMGRGRRVKFTHDVPPEQKFQDWLEMPYKHKNSDWVSLKSLEGVDDDGVLDTLRRLFKQILLLKNTDAIYDKKIIAIFAEEEDEGIKDYILLKNYFEDRWFFFRQRTPELPIIPTVIMLIVERNYLYGLLSNPVKGKPISNIVKDDWACSDKHFTENLQEMIKLVNSDESEDSDDETIPEDTKEKCT